MGRNLHETERVFNERYPENPICRKYLRDLVAKFQTSGNICDGSSKLLHVLSTSSKTIVGSFRAELCSPAYFISNFYNHTLSTWNCPQVFKEIDTEQKSRLSPSIPAITSGFSRVVLEMKWKSVAIISGKMGWWPLLSQSIDVRLREVGVVPRHFLMIGQNTSQENIENKLGLLKKIPCRGLFSP
ncbi:unnamed protein product [Brassicogethes aeneus]|uniref:Uncharacterized protein n=1 Tax=Brassicogethes aeneus TaxID=1431903 RepID=A0A9P0B304_BRAAE|nr:unnamed protein product [Brassicogethes aeneus]